MTANSEEAAFTRGMRTVYLANLAEALRGLGRDDPAWTASRWALEREATVAALRRICADYGDNDWSDDLHLADVVEKHLARYLE